MSCPHAVIDHSSHGLTDDERIFLGLGMNFNLQPSEKDTISTVASFDKFFYKHSNRLTECANLRGLISPLLLSFKRETPLLPVRLNKSMSVLSKDRSIVILPADKGGNPVVLDSCDYVFKARQLLSDFNTYEILNSCPLVALNKQVRSNIREIAKLCPDPKFFNRFLRDNCTLLIFMAYRKLIKWVALCGQ